MADETAQVATDPVISDELTTAADMHDTANEQMADAPVEEAEGQEGAADEPEIVAPQALNAEGKAMFAALPREAQQWWADTETTRARQVTEATTRAANRERDALALHQRVEAETKGLYARQLMTFLAAQQPQEPDPTHYQDINQYNQARTDYQHRAQHFGAIVQQVQALGGEAQQGMQAATQQAIQDDARVLHASLPEWFDETKGPALREKLTAIAVRIGYGDRMGNADATDILALHDLSKDVDDAAKYRKLMSERMKLVRNGKGSVPPNARGAAVNGQAAPRDTAAAMYPDDVRR
jgi:hypothetical protein